MEPTLGIWLGGILGCGALCLGAIKWWRPASPLHRWGGRLAVIPGLLLLIGMIARTVRYQVPLRPLSRIHLMIGVLAFLLFAAKFLARRNILISPRRMTAIGYALTILFPLAAFGMVLPYAQCARAWQSLTPSEVVERPDQAAFNRICVACHDRETAVEGLGRRSIPRWIAIVEPMAWAGACGREETRGALAAVLATAAAPVAPSQSSVQASAADAIDRFCIGCHDRQRTTSEKPRTRESWERVIARMQKYTVGRSDVATISDAAAAEVLEAVIAAGLVASAPAR
ncbi:MAG TPA: hypothetical protein VIV61_02145 [Candidatus Ozemobacteraceae bacterium]